MIHKLLPELGVRDQAQVAVGFGVIAAYLIEKIQVCIGSILTQAIFPETRKRYETH